MTLKPIAFGLLLAALSAPAVAAEREVTFSVPGMTCASCPFIVESAMAKIEGVKRVDTSLETKTATVLFDDAVTTADAISQASANAGYEARLVEDGSSS